MDLKMVVSLSLLCTDAEWDNVCRIRNLVSDATLSNSEVKPSIKEPIDVELTDGETHLLDAMSQETHENGGTPLMDLFEVATTGRGRKPSPTSIPSLAVKFISEKGETERDSLIEYVLSQRPDLNYYKVQNGLNTMRYSKGKKKRLAIKDNGMWILHVAEQ
jgi:hypothetical protein